MQNKGVTYYLKTCTWWAYVTAEDAYALNGADYEATLTVAGETFKIVIPASTYNAGLKDNAGVQWTPPVALGANKVYGQVDKAIDSENAITMVADAANASDLTLTSGKTLNLNGHTLTIAGGTMTFNDGSVVTGAGSIVTGGGSANALPGAKFSFDPTDLIANKTLYKAVDNGDGTYTIGYNHIHAWQGAASGNTLTVTCQGEGECEAGGVASAVITATGKTYDGQAVVATVTPSENFGATGWTIGSVVYKQGNETVDSAINAGDYTAEVTINGFTISQSFSIAKASLTALTISASSFNYTGADQHVDITSVKAGNLDATYEETEDSVRSAKGSGAADVSYAVKVRGTGNFTGEATATWTIKAPTGSFAGDALSTSAAGCTAGGNAVTVTDSTKLEYVAENTWQVSAVIKFPRDFPSNIISGDTSKYIGADQVLIEDDKDGETTLKTDVKEYKAGSFVVASHTYADCLTWKVQIPLSDITSAIEGGKSQLDYTITVGACAWDRYTTGLKSTTYTLTVPIDENLKLNDQYGNQVYPALPYVAQVGNIKYLQLKDAIDVANAGDDKTVNLIGNAEAGTFSVGKNVTVNLGGFGNAGAVYMLDCDDLNLGAKVVSTKEEDVRTSVTGFAVKNENNTYTLYRAHLHTWSYALNGDTLTATCVTGDGTPCDQKTVTVQLTVSGAADGVAPTASLGADAELFAKLTGASFGTVGYVRDTDDGAACAKWYVGDYTASCTVTVGGEDRTLTKAFSIAGTTADKYTSGYAVASRNIRYGTWAEALAAASKGDTIYWHAGTLNQKSYYFNSDKDITVDCCGVTLTHIVNGGDMELWNNGTGKVTLQNVTIQQPRDEKALGYAGDIRIVGTANGKLVFGENLKLTNKASSADHYAVIRTGNDAGNNAVSLEIAAGDYEIRKLTGSVTVTGGRFWDCDGTLEDHVEGLGDTHVIRKISDGNYVAQVVKHEHVLTYTANGNVITVLCTAEKDADICTYKPNNGETLTLTAATVKVADLAGGAYAYADYVCTDKFPVKDAVITYWQEGQQLEGAPTDTGDYVAKVTVGEATAEATFRIIHTHSYSYAVEGDSIVATCEAVGSCDAPRFTATLTANGATYTGSAYTGASTSVDEGYPVEVALTYWQGGQRLEGAPTNAGDYIAKMSAGGQTVEKAFTIAKADFASVTFALEKGEFKFDHEEHTAVLATHALGGYVLVGGVDYVLSGDALTQVGSPAEDKTYTVTLTGAGNFTGTKELSWTISAPTGKMGKLEEIKGEGQTALAGVIDGTTLTVTLPTNLCFLGGAWYAGLSVEVPNSIDGWSSDNSSGTNPNDLILNFSHEGELYQVSEGSYQWTLSGKTITYAKSITWFTRFTLAEVAEAIGRGDTELVHTLTVFAVPGSFNKAGIREVVYTIKLPLTDLVLPVPAGQTLAAGDAAISGYKLLLGKGAKVTANAKVADFRTVIVPQEKSEIVKESGNGPYTYSAVNKGLMILFGIGQ